MTTTWRCVAVLWLLASIGTSSADQHVLIPSGSPTLSLSVPDSAKIVETEGKTVIQTADMFLHVWAIPGAATIADGIAGIKETIKGDVTDFVVTGSNVITIAGADAMHLMGDSNETDDGDPGHADVVVFSVGGHVFAACVHGEDQDAANERAPMLAVLATASVPAPATTDKTVSLNISSSTPSDGVVGNSLRNEGQLALTRALDWLAAKQATNGCWSSPQFPAMTALVLEGFLKTEHPRRADVLKMAAEFILSCVREDGGIYCDIPGRKGGGLSNYNTAICLSVLNQLDDPELRDVLLHARVFLAKAQHKGDDIYRGGFGYDETTGRAYTDMMNTYYAVESMSETAPLEDVREGERVDLDWGAVTNYLSRMQNTTESGDQAGGFFYNPSDPKAGTITNDAGHVNFRSYGSITYVGLMGLLYAHVDQNDTRVKSAFQWAGQHWTLDENPNMGSDGQYFFYDILGKCMGAYGHDTITQKDGTPLAWREAMIKKLVSLQKVDATNGTGYWVNDSNRYMEADPVLVTAYTVMALQHALN